MLMANRSTNGIMSSPNDCSAAASRSRIRRRMAIITPAMTKNGGPHQAMKDDGTQNRFNGKRKRLESEEHDAVAIEIVALDGKMDPAENERESDCRRQNAAPHDQPMGSAARSAAKPNEPINHEGIKQPTSPGH